MQNACMTSITIRNVSKRTHDELASRAASEGQSLQEYLLRKLDEIAEKPDMKTVLARIRAWKEETGVNVSTETILADLRAERE